MKLQSESSFALPLSQAGVEFFSDLTRNGRLFPESFVGCRLTKSQFPQSKKELAKAHNEHELLFKAMEHYLRQFPSLSSAEKDELLSDLPAAWVRHGDLVVLPNSAFVNKKWSQLSSQNKTVESTFQAVPKVPGDHIWTAIASALKCKRLAIDNQVKCDRFRSSGTTLVLGEDGWVEHIDNGIKYTFDVTKVMFSAGNITEKIRVAGFSCQGETVLDLYAGIGYFTLPYLVHAQAELVHACEWNSDAVAALERGLKVNGVSERCVVHYGDNRKVRES